MLRIGKRIARGIALPLVVAMFVCAVALWPRSYRDGDVLLTAGVGSRMYGGASFRGRLILFGTDMPFDPRRQLALQRISAPAAELRPLSDAAFDSGTTLKLSVAGFQLGRGAIDAGFTEPPTYTAIGIPDWFAVLATGIPTVVWLRALARRWRWAIQGRCRACGYDLRSTPQRCPECGAAAPRKRRRAAPAAIASAAVVLFGLLLPGAASGEEPAAAKRLDEVNIVEATLEDSIDFLRDRTHANIVVRWPALEAAGVARTTPVKLRLWNVSLGKVLDLLLDTSGGGTVAMGWAEEGGIITVSTSQDIERSFRPTVYDVRDLVMAMRSPVAPSTPDAELESWQEAVDALTRLITETVEPDSWRDAGGTTGSMREMGGRLIITQSPAAKKKIEDLLGQLRREFSKPPATQPVGATIPSTLPDERCEWPKGATGQRKT